MYFLDGFISVFQGINSYDAGIACAQLLLAVMCVVIVLVLIYSIVEK
jgi:hypothetical protein